LSRAVAALTAGWKRPTAVYTSTRLQVETTIVSATFSSCCTSCTSFRSASPLTDTFSSSATGAVRWLSPPTSTLTVPPSPRPRARGPARRSVHSSHAQRSPPSRPCPARRSTAAAGAGGPASPVPVRPPMAAQVRSRRGRPPVACLTASAGPARPRPSGPPARGLPVNVVPALPGGGKRARPGGVLRRGGTGRHAGPGAAGGPAVRRGAGGCELAPRRRGRGRRAFRLALLVEGADLQLDREIDLAHLHALGLGQHDRGEVEDAGDARVDH